MRTDTEGVARRSILYKYIKAMPQSKCTLKNNEMVSQLGYNHTSTVKRDIKKLEALGVISRSYSHRTQGEFYRTLIAI